MIYAMSDIHGMYDKYTAMLKKVHFSPADTLYVLGDVVDRGPDSMRVLQDMAARENVYPLLGNHEAAAIEMLRHLMVEITEENYRTHVDAEILSRLMDWQMDGGAATLQGFQKLSIADRCDVLDYLQDFALCDVVDAGGRTFILCHAGLQNFAPERSLDSYLPQELILGRHDYTKQYFPDPDIHIVTGHTPTISLTGKPEILFSCSNIGIDCGASYPGGRLGCLCLDTLEEFYT